MNERKLTTIALRQIDDESLNWVVCYFVTDVNEEEDYGLYNRIKSIIIVTFTKTLLASTKIDCIMVELRHSG